MHNFLLFFAKFFNSYAHKKGECLTLEFLINGFYTKLYKHLSTSFNFLSLNLVALYHHRRAKILPSSLFL